MDEKMRIALVAYSFSLREGGEPNPCNWRLALETKRLLEKYTSLGYEVFIAAQWEVGLALSQLGIKPDLIVEKSDRYLDSDEVWEVTKERLLFPNRITTAIPVVQPFLQRFKVVKMMKYDVDVIKEKRKWIGFDPKSDQPWCRGPVRLISYAIKQKLTGSSGLA